MVWNNLRVLLCMGVVSTVLGYDPWEEYRRNLNFQSAQPGFDASAFNEGNQSAPQDTAAENREPHPFDLNDPGSFGIDLNYDAPVEDTATSSHNPYIHEAQFPSDFNYLHTTDQFTEQPYNQVTAPSVGFNSEYINPYFASSLPENNNILNAGTANIPDYNVPDVAGSSRAFNIPNPEEDEPFIVSGSREEDCYFSIKPLSIYHGVIIRGEDIVYPEEGHIIHIPNNGSFAIICIGVKSFLTAVSEEYKHHFKNNYVLCQNGKLLYQLIMHDWRELKPTAFNCSRIAKPSLVKKSHGHYRVQLGSNVLYDLYVDEPRKGEPQYVSQLLYLEHSVRTAVGAREKYGPQIGKPEYLRSTILDLKKDHVWYGPQAGSSMIEQLRSPELYAWFSNNFEERIVRGRLMSTKDFVYFSEQWGAFFHVSTVPMWSNLERNWMAIEDAISAFVAGRQKTLTIYTGISPEEVQFSNGMDLETLYLPNSDSKYITVIPQFLWKMAHDPTTGGCVMIIAHNSVHSIPAELRQCPDISSEFQWLAPSLLNEYNHESRLGSSYACSCLEIEPPRDTYPSRVYRPKALEARLQTLYISSLLKE